MQGFKVEEKTIGGYTYKVTQLDAKTGRRAFTRFNKIAAPALAKLREGSTLGAAIGDALERLTEDDMDHFCDLFSRVTAVSGGDLQPGAEPQLNNIFGVHFAGRYFEMLEWLGFCLKVNFESFFAGVAVLMLRAAAAAQAAETSGSTSQSTPTGSSGD